MAGKTFFAAQTSNGNSAIYQGISIDPVRPCPFDIFVTGVFGGASVTAYATADGVNWLTIPGAALSAPGILQIDISANAIMLTVSGATGTTNINAISVAQ